VAAVLVVGSAADQWLEDQLALLGTRDGPAAAAEAAEPREGAHDGDVRGSGAGAAATTG
jgi:hypothetical protein